jgi:hypothetical protein
MTSGLTLHRAREDGHVRLRQDRQPRSPQVKPSPNGQVRALVVKATRGCSGTPQWSKCPSTRHHRQNLTSCKNRASEQHFHLARFSPFISMFSAITVCLSNRLDFGHVRQRTRESEVYYVAVVRVVGVWEWKFTDAARAEPPTPLRNHLV